MAEPTPESSYDAVKFVTTRMRIVFGLMAVLTTPVVWVVVHLVDVGVFIESSRAHEGNQDQTDADFKVKFKLLRLEGVTREKMHKRRVGMLLEAIDGLRESMLEMAPRGKQARLRREFRVQRDKERKALLGND